MSHAIWCAIVKAPASNVICNCDAGLTAEQIALRDRVRRAGPLDAPTDRTLPPPSGTFVEHPRGWWERLRHWLMGG